MSTRPDFYVCQDCGQRISADPAEFSTELCDSEDAYAGQPVGPGCTLEARWWIVPNKTSTNVQPD